MQYCDAVGNTDRSPEIVEESHQAAIQAYRFQYKKHPGFTVGQRVRAGKNGIVRLCHTGTDPGNHTGGRSQACRNIIHLINPGRFRQVNNLNASFIANQNGNDQNNAALGASPAT